MLQGWVSGCQWPCLSAVYRLLQTHTATIHRCQWKMPLQYIATPTVTRCFNYSPQLLCPCYRDPPRFWDFTTTLPRFFTYAKWLIHIFAPVWSYGNTSEMKWVSGLHVVFLGVFRSACSASWPNPPTQPTFHCCTLSIFDFNNVQASTWTFPTPVHRR